MTLETYLEADWVAREGMKNVILSTYVLGRLLASQMVGITIYFLVLWPG